MKKRQSSRRGDVVQVLLADDDDEFRDGLKREFEKKHCRVECVRNAEAAINRIAAKQFDVIVLDVFMPWDETSGKDEPQGIVALPKILRRYADLGRNAIIAIFTAYPTAEHAFSAIDQGAYYLPKRSPDGPDLADDLVKECLRRVRGKGTAIQQPRHNWLDDHFSELLQKFAGKTIGVLHIATDTGDEKTITIGERKVIWASSPKQLRRRILNSPALREADPSIIEISETRD